MIGKKSDSEGEKESNEDELRSESKRRRLLLDVEDVEE